jgi:hypothetical protein
MSARKTDNPPPEEKPTAKAAPQQAEVTPGPQIGIMPLAAPTLPAGYTQTRTITVEVWSGTGRTPMYYVAETPYRAFHGSADGVRQDLLNRLSPPPAPSGAG